VVELANGSIPSPHQKNTFIYTLVTNMFKLSAITILSLATSTTLGAGIDKNWFTRAIGDSCNAKEGQGTCQSTANCKFASCIKFQIYSSDSKNFRQGNIVPSELVPE
jgi:hypothetical protein